MPASGRAEERSLDSMSIPYPGSVSDRDGTGYSAASTHASGDKGNGEVTREPTAARYNRIAWIYDCLESLSEGRMRPWREHLWALARGQRILEVGVGTGKNLPYHPRGASVTGIDVADKMLNRARGRAADLGSGVLLLEADVQALPFPDDSFDTAVATFVFCSVSDPILGLRELNRVVRPGGQILLLEHVRIDRPVVGWIMDRLNPIVVRAYGANINRRTVDNVRLAGLAIETLEHRGPQGMVKLMEARPAKPRPSATQNGLTTALAGR